MRPVCVGILLARPISKNSLKLAMVITGLKMLLHPILGVLIIILAGGYAIEAARTTLMVTVAPVGVMALTFASRQTAKQTQSPSQPLEFCPSVILVPIFAVIDDRSAGRAEDCQILPNHIRSIAGIDNDGHQLRLRGVHTDCQCGCELDCHNSFHAQALWLKCQLFASRSKSFDPVCTGHQNGTFGLSGCGLPAHFSI